MEKIVECPVCKNQGLKIEIDDDCRIVTSGKKIKDYDYIAFCSVCKRKIHYDVENVK